MVSAQGGSPAVQTLFASAVQHQRAGRLDDAGRLYRQILAFDPAHADSLHLLGVIAHKSGDHDLAIDMIRRAITIRPSDPSYHANLGNLLQLLGRTEEAADCHRRAADLKSDDAATFNERGKALRRDNRPDQALACYDRALALRPNYAEVFNNRGNVLLDLSRPLDALASYARALALEPNYVEALNNRGNALRAVNRPAEALLSYDRALALRPDDAGVLTNRGNALRDLNRSAEALASYDQALLVRPDDAGVLNNRGAALRDLDRQGEALASYDQALALKPHFAEAFCNKGILLTELGRFEEANRDIETATKIDPRNARYHYIMTISKRTSSADAHVQAMEELARDMPSLPIDDQVYLHFALGKVFADANDHARSFRHLLEGNMLKRSQTAYDETATLDFLERTRTSFTSDLMLHNKSVGYGSPVPIFILGMPRSGSTLVEQILASHPQVHGAGEIDDFEQAMAKIIDTPGGSFNVSDMLSLIPAGTLRRLGADYVGRIRRASPQAERIINKTPDNFRFIGLIHLALPNARIIHTRRDPIDTCLSCFSHLFVKGLNYTYSLAELGRYYRAYGAMMEHWRGLVPNDVLLDLQYEDLVDDLERRARQIVSHCGLEWDSRCLDFHRTERAVRTASTSQVRQPIYRSSVGRWRALEPFLGPLLAEL